MSVRGQSFCKSSYWDLDVTWYAEWPDFTPCFHTTVLVWIPCVLLWLLAPFEVYLSKISRRQSPVSWTFLSITKVGLCLLLLGLSFAELVLSLQRYFQDQLVYNEEFCSASTKIITFFLVLFLLILGRRGGKQSSAVLLIFWFFLSICGMFSYRSVLHHVFWEESFSTHRQEFVLQMLYFPIVLSELILSGFKESIPRDEEIWKFEELSFLSRLTFSWCDSLILKGFRDVVHLSDLFPISNNFKSIRLWTTFKKPWKKELIKAKLYKLLHVTKVTENGKQEGHNKQKSASLIIALGKGFWPFLMFGLSLELVYSLLRFLPPLVMNLMIDFVSSNEPAWRGFFYAAIMFLSAVIASVIMNHLIYFVISAALRIKSALITAVYRKSLKMSSSARRNYTVGELVNLMAVDAEKIFNLSMYLTLIIGAPLRILFTIVLLWQYLGPACLAGVVIILVVFPLTGIFASKMRKVQEQQMTKKDSRLKFMNEILSGIKVLKLYAWEIPFINQVTNVRNDEINLLRTYAFNNAGVAFIWGCAPFMIAITSFVTFLLIDENNILDATTAFVSLTLFNMLRFSLVVLPDMISNIVQTRVSIHRLNEFLVSEELDPNCVGTETDKGEMISINNGTCSWETHGEAVLKNINLHIKTGQLVAIVGQVGSGKSSILSSLLGEMYKLSGTINIKGTTAYVSQQAWIQNMTLKQNVLFCQPLNEKKYKKVIDKCCLRPDLMILPGGDEVEIGEKGVNLSGGQKQRINLARAVYQDADVYLLDDPLSAVDSHVAKSLFQHVIGSNGLLQKKTRILVTHNLSVLPDVDAIIVMKNGQVEESGTYKELLAKKGSFFDLVREHMRKDSRESSKEESSITNSSELDTTLLQEVTGKEVDMRVRHRKRRKTEPILTKTISREVTRDDKIGVENEGLLVEEEKMELGKVKAGVYFHYLQNATYPLVFFTVLGYAGFQACEVGANIWLSKWSMDDPLPDGSQDIPLRNTRLIVYAVLGISEALCILFGTIMLAIGAVRASRELHKRMLQCVIRTPMAFFDTTPLGRILNRFGKDIDVVDSQLPMNFDGALDTSLAVIGTAVVISISNPIFIVALIPVLCIYYLLQKIFINTSRQMKRLESVTRSPIYNNFSETITGASSIRAYGVQKRFIGHCDERIDVNQNCHFIGMCINRWLAARLDFLGCCIVLIASLLAATGRGTMSSGIVGLSLSYALNVTEVFSWLVRMSAELETKIVSVERIDEYSQLSSEAPWEIESTKPHKLWPSKGMVKFFNYSTRYREGLDMVLKNIDLEVTQSEKVGIVGRTGAGKSSLTLALFRIIEPAEGTIVIDDIDITVIGLHDLRSKLTIIPQDPVLFTGTLRMNIDPNNEFSDEDVWRAFEHSHLKQFVSTLQEGLSYPVAENGENFSVGQKQLICLARALLRKTKVLVLDEATAAVDLDTDRLIQNTIKKEFNQCTVITIAHRINTIMDYNRVIVMDEGVIKESGNPTELLSNPESMFYSMAKYADLID
ncbi:multidrug resistance-associated protein 1-like isoform X1 [Tachypleus tridentatus]|uniref:multidrug resistance-associated protein 1-like isoform X1 n=1 Tax=Tachypleus tridentatus TaxID=6853 RepID=UPI003FCF29C2